MARGDWGHKLSPVVPGGECSLCGHVGTPRDPVLSSDESELRIGQDGKWRVERWTAYRCMDAFACQDRRAKRGGAGW